MGDENSKTFPYKVDNVPMLKKSFTLTKVFDNKARRFKKDQEVGDLDIKVNF